ncbi:DUF6011 domain-containing protein [Streptomyces sp. NPDC058316]|uniref:DUF6011 domain-containing protein n=1 Tax=Streptomyces sp. NPDC058316 TaxID=3346442 RepID=UPI0036E821FD
MTRALPPDSTAPPPRCAACRRLLRSQASRARGLGPHCARLLRGHTGAFTGLPAADIPIPGQTELLLRPMQPTLWSL